MRFAVLLLLASFVAFDTLAESADVEARKKEIVDRYLKDNEGRLNALRQSIVDNGKEIFLELSKTREDVSEADARRAETIMTTAFVENWERQVSNYFDIFAEHFSEAELQIIFDDPPKRGTKASDHFTQVLIEICEKEIAESMLEWERFAEHFVTDISPKLVQLGFGFGSGEGRWVQILGKVFNKRTAAEKCTKENFASWFPTTE